MKKKILLALLLVFVISSTSYANWTASKTITVEKHDELEYFYTTVVNYEATDWLHITGVFDKQVKGGLDGNFSITAYVPFKKVLYLTSGVRKGIYESDLPWIPYFQVTVHF